MKLIVNGDDFGYSKGQNLGILECFKSGVMKSCSLMVNMPGFDDAIELMKTHPELNVGIHFVMTIGSPILSTHKTIVNGDGVFDKDLEKINNGDIEEIKAEYRAQTQKFLDTGFTPDHIDFHVAVLDKQFIAAMEIAKELNIPMRGHGEILEKILLNNIKCSTNFMNDFYKEGVSIEGLIKVLEDNKDKDLIELMSHPAYVDATILKTSSYNTYRALEVDVLTSKEIKDYISKNNIELISFKDL